MKEAVNMHDAKTNLSKLVERVARGETIVIARAGKPVAKLAPVDSPKKPQRLGFMKGEFSVPEDFDEMGREEIEEMFSAKR